MRLYVDLETLQLIEGPGFRNPVISLRFKRGDSARLEVVFLEGGSTPVSIGDPATLEIQFGIKPRSRYDVGYLVHSAAWTMPAPAAESPVYLCSPSFNTVELDAAMQVGSPTGTELSEITLMGEITWREGAGDPTSTRTFLVIVENDVNRGTEGVPTDADPAYPLPGAIELLANKGVANGYASLGSNGKVPTAQLPTIPAAILHSNLSQFIEVGNLTDIDLGATGSPDDLIKLHFHSWIANPQSFDRISFQLLDSNQLAVLESELRCSFEGVDGVTKPSWLWEIWIEGAFDPSRPTAIWIDGRECPNGDAPFDFLLYSHAWTGSGGGTQDEMGQINLAAVSGWFSGYEDIATYGYPGLTDTPARYLRIRNDAVISNSPLSLRGVQTRIPRQL